MTGIGNLTGVKGLNSESLSFVVYMIHACANKWLKNPDEVYALLQKSGCIDNYLVLHYEVLHTLGTDYITADIEEYLEIRGLQKDQLPISQTSKNVQNTKEDALEKIYQESLEERIISHLTEVKELSFSDAMTAYYSSKLAGRIHKGEYGVQYLDHKVLVQILCETEPELFCHD